MVARGGVYDGLYGDGREVNSLPSPRNAYPRIYLRCIDPGTDNECWVVCAKGDPGAIAFLREDGM